MYTLDEINEKAKSAAIKASCTMFIFVILIPVLLLLWMVLIGGEGIQLFPIDEKLKKYLYSSIPTIFPSALFAAIVIYYVRLNATKKKLEKENEQEDIVKREEHYRRMEELLEKMSKDK